MLTLDMLYAVIQGLPADHLDYLDRPWYLLAVRIERALKEGLDPTSALHSALSNSADWERQVYLRAFIHEEPVLALPDLTPRQKEALIALRYAGACSLAQLCRILVQERSNTRRRLDVLIEKGYVIKYFRRDGAYYLAITSFLDDATKSKAAEMMQSFKQFLLAEQGSVSEPNQRAQRAPRSRKQSATTSTRSTSITRESRDTRESRITHPPRPP